jgi:hypothetical protein
MTALEARRPDREPTEDRWTPRPYARAELREALLAGGVAGHEVTHPLDNVLWKIERIGSGDPDVQFGISGLAGAFTSWEVMELVAEASGFVPDPSARWGPVSIDPDRVIDACEAAGDRLALACRRGERVLLATGHPTGLPLLYLEVGRQLVARGVELVRPLEGEAWEGGRRRTRRQVRFIRSVAMLTMRGSVVHTHDPEPMFRMLASADPMPDLVFADHGFAGAAIEKGVETIGIADVNDPALVVARALGRSEHVIVMDDNVDPDAYWPCFQAISARLP